MRISKTKRKTNETDIEISLNIDGKGNYDINTGIRFFDHLLSSFAKHGLFDLNVRASGDNEHHIVEDVAISLGAAFRDALKEKRSIRRFGSAIIPMDDVLLLVSVDISGRSHCNFDVNFSKKSIEGMSIEMISHFIETFVSEFKINLHAKLLDGKNDHHKSEALFKALALALDDATKIDTRREDVPSTKGLL
ncbi:MAG: imidazoleglycerol-phosphate dehydratase HisB [Methanosarcinales archaeon Met12]|nr:MAG: imidazoleglycerol-phosphate dehydratase HisB [Methanosarcinales archaeon Met12]